MNGTGGPEEAAVTEISRELWGETVVCPELSLSETQNQSYLQR